MPPHEETPATPIGTLLPNLTRIQNLVHLDRTQLPPVQPLHGLYWMPFSSLQDKFIGRVKAIWELHDSLFKNGTTVLQGVGVGVVAGTGGLGKTQLAIEYAHRFGHHYPGGVYWVDAEQGVIEMVTRISAAAKVSVELIAEKTVQVAQLWQQINNRNQPCLVILDNLSENATLRSFLPATGNLHTIVTTRRQDLNQATVRLPVLTPEDSIRLLNSGERTFEESDEPLKQLAERLGGHALSLELSRSYLNARKELTPADLLEEMDSQGEISVLQAFLDECRDQLPSGHEPDIPRTFQLSWQLASATAQSILRVMGELAPAPVPRLLLRLVLDLPQQSPLKDELSKAIGELERLSLVELSGKSDPAAHRLILAFARHRNATDAASPLDRCSKALIQQMERTYNNPDNATMRELEALLPHAEFLAESHRVGQESAALLLSAVGTHHQVMGRFTAARLALESALASARTSFEPGHPEVATYQNNLALVLQDLGRFEEARDLLRKALTSAETSFEPGHPLIAARQSNLASVLRDLRQLEEARDLLRDALISDEKSFEPGHPTIANRQSSLALVLQYLGQLEEARDLLRKALTSAENSFEPGHPTIAIRQSNLAQVLQDLGQLEEARDLLQKVLASHENSYEPGHPNIAVSQSNLASVLRDLNQLEKALDLNRKALNSDMKSFEPGHPTIAIRKWNLAQVFTGLGQLEEAAILVRAAHTALLDRLGPNHPHTLAAQQWLHDFTTHKLLTLTSNDGSNSPEK